MIFKDLYRGIELYLHIQGTEARYLIKDFINESILDFLRLKEWERAKTVEDIALDGSGQYDLDTILTNFFGGEIALLTEGGMELKKYNYDTYLQLTNKTDTYALLGNILFVEGDGVTLKFIYKTMGNPYPLVNDDDENLVTKYYWDIIKKMAEIKMLDYLGDEMSAKETQNLQLKLISLKETENRIRKQGKFKMVNR